MNAIASLLLAAILLVSVSCTRVVRAPPLPHLDGQAAEAPNE